MVKPKFCKKFLERKEGVLILRTEGGELAGIVSKTLFIVKRPRRRASRCPPPTGPPAAQILRLPSGCA